MDGMEKYIATGDERHLSFAEGTARTRTITAVTECELCYLSRQSVIDLSVAYPELRARLKVRFSMEKNVDFLLKNVDCVMMTAVHAPEACEEDGGHSYTLGACETSENAYSREAGRRARTGPEAGVCDPRTGGDGSAGRSEHDCAC